MELDAKYNYQEREEYWRKYWEDEGIYKFDENSNNKVYSVDTPPPYVSADHLHSGHIMSYSQAEFVVRYKRMKGYNVYYPMGFDDNGFPTERYVEKKHNVDKSKVNRQEFIELCLKETQLGSENYKKLWLNLGISVDWSKTYSTINPLCQKISQKSFINLLKKGYIYRKKEPYMYCPTCKTALAQADMEDETVKTLLNYINFEVENEKVTIATTRPELIGACVALFVNSNDKRYKNLIGKSARVPLFDYEVKILSDDKVDPEFGTGIMMVCSWGDTEDVRRIKENNLSPRIFFNKEGQITDLGTKYQGMYILDARKKIVEDLKNKGLLIKQHEIEHVVNVHERCNTPVEYIVTEQWFIDVLSRKDVWIKQGRKMEWYPENMRLRYEEWINGLKWDWCISRQRYFGVPIPVWYCQDCGMIIYDEEKLPIDPSTDKCPYDTCPQCGSKNIIPDTDVMDTWATSSSTPSIIKELINGKNKDNIFPSSLRPQAHEIIRTWLFYSVVKAYYDHNDVPFKEIMISGHGLDEQGRKISKRLGNYIEPNILLRDYGADAIRYWATGAMLGTNHRFQIKEVEKGKYTVNKLWNASRFCSMKLLDGVDLNIEFDKLEIEDKWIISELQKTIKKSTEAFEGYEYSKAKEAIDDLFWKKFCDYYLEMIKCRSNESSVKKTLSYVLYSILKLYAPIMPFITEEIYSKLYKDIIGSKSIHITDWPIDKNEYIISDDELTEVQLYIEEINNVRKVRTDKNMRFSDILEGYEILNRKNFNIKKYGEKLEKTTNCRIKE